MTVIISFSLVKTYFIAIYDTQSYICSAQCRNRGNSGIVQRKVGIPALSADSGIVPDNSRIAQEIYVEM